MPLRRTAAVCVASAAARRIVMARNSLLIWPRGAGVPPAGYVGGSPTVSVLAPGLRHADCLAAPKLPGKGGQPRPALTWISTQIVVNRGKSRYE
jgi:hypothetical protein